MAIHASSTPALARPLLRACLPVPLDPEAEFVMLVALRDRTTVRLHELTAYFRARYGDPKDIERRIPLPQSGLVRAAPGILLFRGGRDA